MIGLVKHQLCTCSTLLVDFLAVVKRLPRETSQQTLFTIPAIFARALGFHYGSWIDGIKQMSRGIWGQPAIKFTYASNRGRLCLFSQKEATM